MHRLSLARVLKDSREVGYIHAACYFTDMANVSTRLPRLDSRVGRIARSRALRGLIAVTSLIVAVTGVAVVWLHRPPTPVTVDDALANFRARPDRPPPTSQDSSPVPTVATPPGSEAPVVDAPSIGAPTTEDAGEPASAALAANGRPEQGVYSYETSGGGSTDALGGARQNYPPQTPVTVTHTACGYTLRWQPLRERWDEWEFCGDSEQLTTTRITTYIEIYGQSRRDDYACDAAATSPSGDGSGTQRSWTCRSTDAELATTYSVIGAENVSTKGGDVPTMHVRFRVIASGSVRGEQTLDWWIQPATGLPVRMQRVAEMSQSSPVGDVHYHEEFTSTCESLSPQR